MKKVLISILFFFISFINYAQLENANWCFAQGSKVSFNSGTPIVGSSSNIYNNFGDEWGGSSSSVSDVNGNLLFYTNGIKVWDKNNNVMPNGLNLAGGIDNVPLSANQSNVIIPKPGSQSIYYIFTAYCHLTSFPIQNTGIYYSIVDMSLNGGNGDIVANKKNIPLKDENGLLINSDNSSTVQQIKESRITTTLNNDNTKIWLSFFTKFDIGGIAKRVAYQYLISVDGINNTLDGISPAPTNYTILNNNFYQINPNVENNIIGKIKFSPNGAFLADDTHAGVILYNFNNQTGNLLFNSILYPFVQGHNSGYGVEFSPNSQVLYFNTYDDEIIQNGINGIQPNQTHKYYVRIRQVDLLTKNTPLIISSIEIPNKLVNQFPNSNIGIPATGVVGELQLALNGKIYVCNTLGYLFPLHYSYIGTIDLPNVLGLGCGYDPTNISLLPNTYQYNFLPQWVHKATPLPQQTGLWTWMKGDNIGNQLGVYGTQGAPSSSNKPGARERAVTWTDAFGNMWLFGGVGLGSTGSVGYLNDLWKYNKTTNEWVWLKGSNICNQLGVYGTQTVSSPLNTPGGRMDGETWSDGSGNLWLFGGRGFNAIGGTVDYNDIWKYNIATNEWTWMKGGNIGNELPVFGTQGIPAIANTPCARSAAVSWLDASGNLWLFGGVGAGFGFCSDLWKYDPISNQWTWVNGDNLSNQPGVYGTIGVTSPTNKPGSRASALAWTDANGNLWMFGGGAGYATGPNSGSLNDLWKYNISINQWTWVKGDNILNQQGIYGTLGLPASTNKPGSRLASVNWIDQNGIIWLFGGSGYATSNSLGKMDDLWKYNTGTNEWTWVGGTNSIHYSGTAVYGTQGIPDPTTTPGARFYSTSWVNSSGNLWLFGGSETSNQLNDLWKYSNCTGPNCFTENGTTTNSLQPIISTKNSNENNFLKAFISPNPTTTNLTLRITENDKQSLAAYNLTVTDKMGGVLLRQANYTSGRGVDISRLEKGVYFATITNNKNEKVTVAFSKL